MTNRSRSAWLLAACACGPLGGCVAAVVPIAASGLIGRSATQRHAHRKRSPVAAPARDPVAVPVPAATPTTRPPAVAAPIPMTHSEPMASPLPGPAAPVRAPVTTATTGIPRAGGMATTWDDVVQYMAKLVLLPPERSRSSVLRAPGDGPPAPCTAAPSAVVVDAATLGRDDYVDLGAIYTMGYEIVFTSAVPSLPAAQVAALAKAGIPAPIRRETLFLAPPGGERTARTAIAARYCVVGLVGNRAADFPGAIIPGARGADAGWFLIR